MKLNSDSSFETRHFDTVLVCVGRVGNVEHLNLDAGLLFFLGFALVVLHLFHSRAFNNVIGRDTLAPGLFNSFSFIAITK